MKEQNNQAKLNLRGRLRQAGVKTTKYIQTNGKQNVVIIFATIALFAIFTLINPGFADKSVILTMSKSLVPYAILALGVTFVIATGGIDLSIGTVCIGSAVLAGAICRTGVALEDGVLWLTIPIILVTGLVFGLINGILVAKCKIAPFIATLGTMLVSRGITSVVAEAVRETSSAVKYPTTGWFQKIFTNYNGFPIGIVWVLGLTVICMVVMYKTKIGRYILAIGSNEEATRLSGINVDKYKIIAYSIGGFFAGMAALFYTASNPSLTIAGGNGMELDAIAGVYIGGTSTTGGAASIAGTILGSVILVVIRQGLNMALSGGSVVSATNITYAVTGVIVVGAVLLDVLKKKAASKVKIESTSDKLKKELKELLETLNVEKDYALSAKDTERVAKINEEIATVKSRLKTEVAQLKAEESAKK
ncbi:MAG: ABC transporter permease [Ruminococcaceae bacterium]|nr:ABC transporter permease [Oscillospiraceae bacterium]